MATVHTGTDTTFGGETRPLDWTWAHRLIATGDSAGPLFVRLALGIVMFAHGAQKLFGWFGGPGYPDTIAFFGAQGVPGPVAFLVVLAESVGAAMLILGLVTRFAAFSIALVMIGAIAMVHWPVGFFMNWMGQQSGEGFEFHLLAIGMAIALMVQGGGRWSVDRALLTRGRR